MATVKMCVECLEEKIAVYIEDTANGNHSIVLAPPKATFESLLSEITETLDIGQLQATFGILQINEGDSTSACDQDTVKSFEAKVHKEIENLETGELASIADKIRGNIPVFVHIAASSGFIVASPTATLKGTLSMAKDKNPNVKFVYTVTVKPMTATSASASSASGQV